MITSSVSREGSEKPRYPTELPELLDGSETMRHRVAIVGAGPVGLSMAMHLIRAGVECVLLEAGDSVCDGSRAIGLSRRSLQILDPLGAADRLVQLGVPRLGSRAFWGGKELGFRPLDNDPRARFPTVVNIEQASIEQHMVDLVHEAGPGVLRWNSRVERIETVDGIPRLTVETPLGSYALDADWVVACDGAASTIRRAYGLRLHGTEYEDRYAIVDISLPSSQYPSERRIWFDPPANPGSTIIMHKQPAGAWRVDFRLRPGEDAGENLDREDLARRVQ